MICIILHVEPKGFFRTTCIVMSVAVLNPQLYNSALHEEKELMNNPSMFNLVGRRY